MVKLTVSAQEKAGKFIEDHALLLDKALYNFHFKDGSKDNVVTELAKYKNDDGGFGNALEPDCRLSESSVIATVVALHILRQIKADSGEQLVKDAVGYLLGQYDKERTLWPIVPKVPDDVPHAPWWDDGESFNQLSNPRPEIVGLLYDYADLVPDKLHETLIDPVIAYLETQPEKLEMHELMSYISLSAAKALPEDKRTRLVARLEKVVQATVAKDPATLTGYALRPLAVVHAPDSPFAKGLDEAVQKDLDHTIQQQGEDGSWAPAWTWGDKFPEMWPIAKAEWQGRLTVNTLLTLRAFDRLEKPATAE